MDTEKLREELLDIVGNGRIDDIATEYRVLARVLDGSYSSWEEYEQLNGAIKINNKIPCFRQLISDIVDVGNVKTLAFKLLYDVQLKKEDVAFYLEEIRKLKLIINDYNLDEITEYKFMVKLNPMADSVTKVYLLLTLLRDIGEKPKVVLATNALVRQGLPFLVAQTAIHQHMVQKIIHSCLPCGGYSLSAYESAELIDNMLTESTNYSVAIAVAALCSDRTFGVSVERFPASRWKGQAVIDSIANKVTQKYKQSLCRKINDIEFIATELEEFYA